MQKFFLGTLGYSVVNDRIVRDVINKTPRGNLVAEPLKRGHPSEKKVNRTLIEEHINSFNPSISHYRREHAPLRKYLPSDINITMMHQNFLQKYPDQKISYELYRQQVNAMKISFAILGHEECWQCEIFNLHETSGHKKENLNAECENCQNWKTHIQHAQAAREEYKKDAAMSEVTFDLKKRYCSVDLQKVSFVLLRK